MLCRRKSDSSNTTCMHSEREQKIWQKMIHVMQGCCNVATGQHASAEATQGKSVLVPALEVVLVVEAHLMHDCTCAPLRLSL
jgi:hypothetical protein